MLNRSKLLHFCEGPGWAGWILVFQLSYAMNHVAPTLHAEESSLSLVFSWLADWFIPLLFLFFKFLTCFGEHLSLQYLCWFCLCVCVCVWACDCIALHLLGAILSWGNVQAVNFFITSCSCNLKILTLKGNNGMNKIKIKKVNYPLCL